MKKKKYNLFNTRKNKKLEQEFLKTNVGKAMFIVLTIGIITTILGFGIALFEVFLLITNTDINEYSFLISLGLASVTTGLVCDALYFVSYMQYRNKK